MISTDTEEDQQFAGALHDLETGFRQHHPEVAALRVRAEQDHLDRPAFFAVIQTRRALKWREAFLIKVALTRALGEIDPLRAVFVGVSSPRPRKSRATQ
jgi:hypothetical protein